MSGFPFVREATLKDAAFIAAIYTESILARDSTMDTEPVSASDMEQMLSSLGGREKVFVAESQGGPVGWGIVKQYSPRKGYEVACETSVYLTRDRRRQGLGTMLQRRLLAYARSARYHHAVAKIWADNRASIAFHESCGFTLVGVQKEVGRVDSVWRDVAILQCLI